MPEISRSMYREKKTKSVGKFEKFDYRLKKAELHLRLLPKRKHGNPTPKFLRFHLPIKSFQSSAMPVKVTS